MGLFLLGFFLALGVGGLLILAFRVITAVIGTVLGIGRGFYNAATGQEGAGREPTVEERVRRENARIEAMRSGRR